MSAVLDTSIPKRTPPPHSGAASNNVQTSNTTTPPVAEESTTCLVTPPSIISIGHMYVYNFTPDSTGCTLPRLNNNTLSPAASSGPICRICHEGDVREDLVSPCRCTGSVGLVHLSCMEKWLSTRCSDSDKCEICNYSFSTVRYPKSLLEWLRSDSPNSEHRRSLLGDITCFLLLTPLASVSSFLCIEGAKRQVTWGNSLEAGCLMALATFLVTIYFIWNILTFRYHLKGFLQWRSRNQNVKLVRIQRVSADDDDRLRAVQVVSDSRPVFEHEESSPEVSNRAFSLP